MYYSYTGRLGVGADVQKYLSCQKRIKQDLNAAFAANGLDAVKLEISSCPVVYASDTEYLPMEEHEYCRETGILYLGFLVEVADFNASSDLACKHLLCSGLLDASAYLVEHGCGAAQISQFDQCIAQLMGTD